MQLTLDLSLALTRQYKSLRAVTAASVYACAEGQGSVAADCDMSPSELSKQLSGSEGRKLDIDDFERILESTRDMRPIYYLIARFLPNDEQRRSAIVSELSALMPRIGQLLAEDAALRKDKRK